MLRSLVRSCFLLEISEATFRYAQGTALFVLTRFILARTLNL